MANRRGLVHFIPVLFLAGVVGIGDSVRASGPAYGSRISFTGLELNGVQLDSRSPILRIQCGDKIEANIAIRVERHGPASSIFPVAGTCSWDRNCRNTLTKHLSPGTHDLVYRFSHQAPAKAGTYWIIVAAGPLYNIDEILGCDHEHTHGGPADGPYGNGNDIWDWETDQFLQAFRDEPVDCVWNGQSGAQLLARTVAVQVVSRDQELTGDAKAHPKDAGNRKSSPAADGQQTAASLQLLELSQASALFAKDSEADFQAAYPKQEDGWYLIKGKLELVRFTGYQLYGVREGDAAVVLSTANALDYWYPGLRANVGEDVVLGVRGLGSAIMASSGDASRLGRKGYPLRGKHVMNGVCSNITGLTCIRSSGGVARALSVFFLGLVRRVACPRQSVG